MIPGVYLACLGILPTFITSIRNSINERPPRAMSEQQFPLCSRDFQIAYPVLTVQDSALCYVKHPARLRNRGYNWAFSHNGNC